MTCSIAVELERLRGEVHSLKEIIRALKASTEAAFLRGEKIMDDHHDRIGKVEKKVWFASGATAAISAAATSLLTKLFGGGHGG